MLNIKITTKAEALMLWEVLSSHVENLDAALASETDPETREELQTKMLAAQSMCSTIDAFMADVGLEGLAG